MAKGIEKSVVSFRISVPVWMPEGRFQELLALFEKYKGVTDEVTFFTVETHSCLALDIILARMEILKARMAEVRRFGYRSGINHLTTIGFFKENAAQSLQETWGQKTYLDGATDHGGRCSNDPKMREYIRTLYRALAATEPDYIWLDDDIHAGTCFCEHCLDRFAQIAGRRYSREELKSAFSEGSIESKLAIRKKWLDHSNRTVGDLLSFVEKTVHEISPNLPLGLMTGDRFYEGYDFDRWAKMLSGPAGAAVKWRPGEGFWNDERPGELIEKTHSIGRQVVNLPETVQDIQAEVENFMYQRLKKSKSMTSLEPAMYIAAGARGAAFNVLHFADQPLEEYESLVARLHQARPFSDLLVSHFGRLKPQGIYTGWNAETLAAMNLSGGEWFAGDVRKIAGAQTGELFEIGLPAAYRLEDARATILVGEAVRSFSPAALEKILSGGVYLDAGALVNLNQMGYGKLTGFDVENYFNADCYEQLVAHPLNGPFTGSIRDGRQSFSWCGWNIPAAVLTPTSEKSQTLSRLRNYAHTELAPCTSGIFENHLGGRVYVGGYFPWIFLQYLAKSTQMKSIFRWLSKDTLPAYIGSFRKINLWTRTTSDNRQVLAILNGSLDPAEQAELLIKTNRREIILYDMNCKSAIVPSSGEDGPYRKFLLPEIAPWQMRLVCEK